MSYKLNPDAKEFIPFNITNGIKSNSLIEQQQQQTLSTMSHNNQEDKQQPQEQQLLLQQQQQQEINPIFNITTELETDAEFYYGTTNSIIGRNDNVNVIDDDENEFGDHLIGINCNSDQQIYNYLANYNGNDENETILYTDNVKDFQYMNNLSDMMTSITEGIRGLTFEPESLSSNVQDERITNFEEQQQQQQQQQQEQIEQPSEEMQCSIKCASNDVAKGKDIVEDLIIAGSVENEKNSNKIEEKSCKNLKESLQQKKDEKYQKGEKQKIVHFSGTKAEVVVTKSFLPLSSLSKKENTASKPVMAITSATAVKSQQKRSFRNALNNYITDRKNPLKRPLTPIETKPAAAAQNNDFLQHHERKQRPKTVPANGVIYNSINYSNGCGNTKKWITQRTDIDGSGGGSGGSSNFRNFSRNQNCSTASSSTNNLKSSSTVAAAITTKPSVIIPRETIASNLRRIKAQQNLLDLKK